MTATMPTRTNSRTRKNRMGSTPGIVSPSVGHGLGAALAAGRSQGAGYRLRKARTVGDRPAQRVEAPGAAFLEEHVPFIMRVLVDAERRRNVDLGDTDAPLGSAVAQGLGLHELDAAPAGALGHPARLRRQVLDGASALQPCAVVPMG